MEIRLNKYIDGSKKGLYTKGWNRTTVALNLLDRYKYLILIE